MGAGWWGGRWMEGWTWEGAGGGEGERALLVVLPAGYTAVAARVGQQGLPRHVVVAVNSRGMLCQGVPCCTAVTWGGGSCGSMSNPKLTSRSASFMTPMTAARHLNRHALL